jgi:16S rRNA (guanine966-N2)-methyltransferase
MRIVAGTAKGVRLAPVPRGVRPLSDRAREGVFSSIGPDVVRGAVVLDLFAGTGATGIEALSRGAAHATFVDRSAGATAAIRRNLELTHLGDRARVVTSDVRRFLTGNDNADPPTDLAFCDPPYGFGPAELDPVLRELTDDRRFSVAPTIVLTRGTQSSMPVIPLHWAITKELRYGDSLVILIRPKDPSKQRPRTGHGSAQNRPRTGREPGGDAWA